MIDNNLLFTVVIALSLPPKKIGAFAQTGTKDRIIPRGRDATSVLMPFVLRNP